MIWHEMRGLRHAREGTQRFFCALHRPAFFMSTEAPFLTARQQAVIDLLDKVWLADDLGSEGPADYLWRRGGRQPFRQPFRAPANLLLYAWRPGGKILTPSPPGYTVVCTPSDLRSLEWLGLVHIWRWRDVFSRSETPVFSDRNKIHMVYRAARRDGHDK